MQNLRPEFDAEKFNSAVTKTSAPTLSDSTGKKVGGLINQFAEYIIDKLDERMPMIGISPKLKAFLKAVIKGFISVFLVSLVTALTTLVVTTPANILFIIGLTSFLIMASGTFDSEIEYFLSKKRNKSFLSESTEEIGLREEVRYQGLEEKASCIAGVPRRGFERYPFSIKSRDNAERAMDLFDKISENNPPLEQYQDLVTRKSALQEFVNSLETSPTALTPEILAEKLNDIYTKLDFKTIDITTDEANQTIENALHSRLFADSDTDASQALRIAYHHYAEEALKPYARLIGHPSPLEFFQEDTASEEDKHLLPHLRNARALSEALISPKADDRLSAIMKAFNLRMDAGGFDQTKKAFALLNQASSKSAYVLSGIPVLPHNARDLNVFSAMFEKEKRPKGCVVDYGSAQHLMRLINNLNALQSQPQEALKAQIQADMVGLTPNILAIIDHPKTGVSTQNLKIINDHYHEILNLRMLYIMKEMPLKVSTAKLAAIIKQMNHLGHHETAAESITVVAVPAKTLRATPAAAQQTRTSELYQLPEATVAVTSMAEPVPTASAGVFQPPLQNTSEILKWVKGAFSSDSDTPQTIADLNRFMTNSPDHLLTQFIQGIVGGTEATQEDTEKIQAIQYNSENQQISKTCQNTEETSQLIKALASPDLRLTVELHHTTKADANSFMRSVITDAPENASIHFFSPSLEISLQVNSGNKDITLDELHKAERPDRGLGR
ncbi:hypothetical protein [Candidatus Synchoanobacter obligatus]|uniref:Uncharacterized protein n=1 Tax=Candidatus Synchoanobacter obligatus TaxID=2919597 RepID=A0ABT1L4M3_9GAMM|nr:hypothetical protein [Candidatus Synchoanobacter obligatus]MCP8351906.1 hypothetical protein [Candidatus Synchoanobacter obligatus]